MSDERGRDGAAAAPAGRPEQLPPWTLPSWYTAVARLSLLIPLVITLAAGSLPDPVTFLVLLVVYAGWSVLRAVWLRGRPVGPAIAARGHTAVAVVADLGLLVGLTLTSGGPDSPVRFAFFVWPVATVLWRLPKATGAVGAGCLAAYVTMLAAHGFGGTRATEGDAAVEASLLLWTVLVCVLIAAILALRERQVGDLLATRRALLRDALAAETRERSVLADALHDGPLQTLLAAGQDLAEATGADGASASVRRADESVHRTVRELREAVFALHPQVLSAAGLGAALRAAGERAAHRGGLNVRYDLRVPGHVPGEQLLYSVANELLTNVVRHARAATVDLRLEAAPDAVLLTVADDGVGIDLSAARRGPAEGHVGLAGHRARLEDAGGTLDVVPGPDGGTEGRARLPFTPGDSFGATGDGVTSNGATPG